jgi:acetoin utilization deacetylase AcuC-like enzyme
MTLLYSSPLFLQHVTGEHPEKPARLTKILEKLRAEGLDRRCESPTWEPATLERLARVHSPDYVREVREFAERGGGRIEADTTVSPRSYDAARLAAGAVTDAVRRVVNGEDTSALCLVRPPGHHALPKNAMGFCLFNNVAIGARTAVAELNLERVMIVDWDVHHGNGTQDIFWSDGKVAFFSIHRYPFYPGTGAAHEVGAGPGKGLIRNEPVAYGTSRKDFRDRFRRSVEALADQTRPQLVIISAGFDAHRLDPIGSLDLEVEDFATLTQIVQGIARTHAKGRIVSVLEGGYHVDMLADSVAAHLTELLKKPD